MFTTIFWFLLFLFFNVCIGLGNYRWKPVENCGIECPAGYGCHRLMGRRFPLICIKDGMIFDGIYPPLDYVPTNTSMNLVPTENLSTIPMTAAPTTPITTAAIEITSISTVTPKISNDDSSKYQLEILRLILLFVTVGMFFSFYVFVRMCKI